MKRTLSASLLVGGASLAAVALVIATATLAAPEVAHEVAHETGTTTATQQSATATFSGGASQT